MARNDPQVNIRLPVELKERLEAAALENHRSFKAEIVARLEDSLEKQLDPAQLPAVLAAETMQQLEDEWREAAALRMAMSQLALVRHVLQRVVDAKGNLSPDLRVLVDLLGGNDGKALRQPVVSGDLLVSAMLALMDHEVVEKVIKSEEATRDRRQRLDAIYEAQSILTRKKYAGLIAKRSIEAEKE